MDSINYSLLENLSDDELQVISRNIDLDMLLQPIKQNSKQYARQSSVLGRLEKKSLLVQKNLPNVAYDLFKKNDVNYVKLFAISVKNLKNILLDIIETGTNGVRRRITIGCNSKLKSRLTPIRPRGLACNCTFLSA